MRRPRRRRARASALSALSALTVLVVLAAPRPVRAQITLLENDAWSLTLGGYVRSITGLHDLGYDLPAPPGSPVPDRESGFHSEVVRLKWILGNDAWRLEVHDRIQARVASSSGEESVLGFGVSAVPDRLVDFRSDFIANDRLQLWHDLDRLSLTVFTDAADVTVGRQAITWGTAVLFPVADLWTRFSPFEQDTEEKPGLDAVRALFYPRAGLEMDAVVAYRGPIDDLSAGLRGTLGLPGADVWAGAGKFWREAMVMGGVVVLLDETKLRAEAVLPWDLDEHALERPRITVGADWIRGTLMLTGEYHFNGLGAADPDGYLAFARDPRLQRGETYYLGRHYLGALASWSPDEANRLTLALNALANLGDGSTAFTPTASYDLGQATRLALGALLSFGDTPVLTSLPPRFPTEFGAYGNLAFTMLSVYF